MDIVAVGGRDNEISRSGRDIGVAESRHKSPKQLILYQRRVAVQTVLTSSRPTHVMLFL